MHVKGYLQAVWRAGPADTDTEEDDPDGALPQDQHGAENIVCD